MYLKIVDRVIYCAIIRNRSTYSPSESFSWEKGGFMRKFGVMMLVFLAVVLGGCTRRSYQTDQLALDTLATEEGWTVATRFTGWRANPHVVRVKNNERSEAGGVVIQVCWSTSPVTKEKFLCNDEAIFPPRK